MTDHTQTGAPLANPNSPAPLAVPWTPPAQQAQAVTPQPVPAQPLTQQPIAPQPVIHSPQHHAQTQPVAPQAPLQPPHNPQAQNPMAYNPAPQAFESAFMQPMPAHQQQPNNMAAGPMTLAPQQGYAPQAMPQQPQMAPQATPAPTGYAGTPQQQMQHPAPQQNLPPMPTNGLAVASAAPAKTSALAKLLKRAPKPESLSVPTSASAPLANVAAAAPKASGSLFNMNFIFGLVAGTVLGFLVLPMLFGGGPEQATPPYTPTAEQTAPQNADVALAESPINLQNGEAFVDAALAQDTP